jgi:hypothetical protein
MDENIDKMCNRISQLQQNIANRSGIVPTIRGILEDWWNNCASFTVTDLSVSDQTYKVTRIDTITNGLGITHLLNIPTRLCTCGKWQEHDYPCVDAFSYFCIHEERTFEYIVDKYVSRWYRYECEQKMLSYTITPVVVDTLVKDGETMPPAETDKKQPGRPKKTRIRNCFKYRSDDSPVVCSLCNERGHNRLTCLARQEQKRRQETEINEESKEYQELDETIHIDEIN